MESDQKPLSRKPLRIAVPELPERALDIDLSSDGVLSPEQRRQRDIDLGNIALLRRQMVPPNDIVVF